MDEEQGRITALLKATFAVAVWGASFIATKVALRELAPMLLIWLRFGIGVAVLALAVVARREFALVSLKELGYFSLLGFLGITFHQWLQANGLVTAQATTTAWIITTIPIFIALLGWLVLKEHLGWSRIGGIAVATVGVLLVVSHGDLGALVHGQFGTRGDFLVLLSAPNWAVFSVLSRRGLQKYPPTQMMLYVMATGWLFVCVLAFADSGFAAPLRTLSGLTAAAWLSVAFLGVLCSGFAYIYWYDALKHLPASRVGVLLYLEPLVAVAVAAVVLQEAILFAAVLGGALILFGVWLVNRAAT
jgi:drug/metabolite transporter (DMT)-like permease